MCAYLFNLRSVSSALDTQEASFGGMRGDEGDFEAGKCTGFVSASTLAEPLDSAGIMGYVEVNGRGDGSVASAMRTEGLIERSKC